MVTKLELEQYRSIVAEMDEVRDRLNNNTVSDTVVGSDIHFPYTAHVIGVGGVTEGDNNQRGMLLLRHLEMQKKAVDDFVEDIEDSLTRRIFRCKYIEGTVKPSWKWVAWKIGKGSLTEEAVKKTVYRYLKNRKK